MKTTPDERATPNGWALAGALTGHLLFGFAWLVVFLSAVFLTSSYSGWADLSLVLGSVCWLVALPIMIIGWQSGSHWYWGVPVAWISVFAIAAVLSVTDSARVSSGAEAGPPPPGTACPKRSPRPQSGQTQADGPSHVAPLIAYVSDSDGDFQIYSMNAEGGDQRRLTRNAAGGQSPAWSPDGTKIAFTRVCAYGGGRYDSQHEVFVMNADGSDQRNLTGKRGWDDESPAWSPDGATIAFMSDRVSSGVPKWGVFVMNADGSDQRVLARYDDRDGHPSWSPDGKRIAFVAGLPGEHVAIYVMNSDGTGQKALTDPRVGSVTPAWSPDGSEIAFTSERNEENEIYVMSPDGSHQRRLTHGGGESAAWSSDGTKIAFMRYRAGNYEVYVMNADGSGQVQLTRNSADDRDPSWQPSP